MEEKNNNGSSAALPMMAMKEIPEARDDAAWISALVKDGGRVTGYQLSTGKTLDKDQALALAKQGGIKGVGISERDGNEYLKSIPDGTENNNLSHLPTVSQ
jgi:hypothetical protein